MSESFGWDALLKTANDAGGAIVPAGDYDARVFSCDVSKSGTQKDQLLVRYEILNGPYAGKKITDRMTISPENANAVAMFFRKMTGLGLDESYFKQQPPPPLVRVATDVVNRYARLNVTQREWNNILQMNVNSVKPLAGVSAGVPTAPVGGPPTGGAPLPPAAAAPVPQPAPVTPPAPMAPPAPMTPPPPPNYAQPAPPAAPSAPAPAPVPASTPSPAPAPASTETSAPSPEAPPAAPAPTPAPATAAPEPPSRPAPPDAPF
jgi:hypothetical protein